MPVAGRPHRLPVLRGVAVSRDVGYLHRQELLARIAEQHARRRVDRDVASFLVRDEDRCRAVFDGLAQQRRLDKRLRDPHLRPKLNRFRQELQEESVDYLERGNPRPCRSIHLRCRRTSSTCSPSSPRSRARPGRSASSPTTSPGTSVTAGSTSTRTRQAPDGLDDRATSTPVSSRRPRASRCSSAPTWTPCRRRRPIEPVVDDGVVRNAAGTILGADDKAAVAVMLEAARRILAENRPHAGVELLFTPKEEVGLVGAYAFDHTRLARAGSATSTTRRRRSAR